MQYTTLYLIRHAESDQGHITNCSLICGWHDVPLTPKGLTQVARLRERLAGLPAPEGVYTSSLRRARATATAAPPETDPVPFDPLREIYCGEYEGKPVCDVVKETPDLWERNLSQSDDDFCWPGGETYRQFRERCLGAVRELVARHRGATIYAFTHAGVVSQVVGSLKGARPAAWEHHRPDHTGITEVRWNGQSGEVLRFSDTAHLLS